MNQPTPPQPQPPLTLTPEELIVITLMRRNTYQTIEVQVQDSVITSVDQTLKFRRKKGGGLAAGTPTRAALQKPPKLGGEELQVIQRIREKPFQKVTINIKNGIDSIFQTVKYRKTK